MWNLLSVPRWVLQSLKSDTWPVDSRQSRACTATGVQFLQRAVWCSQWSRWGDGWHQGCCLPFMGGKGSVAGVTTVLLFLDWCWLLPWVPCTEGRYLSCATLPYLPLPAENRWNRKKNPKPNFFPWCCNFGRACPWGDTGSICTYGSACTLCIFCSS